ncbi:MAG: PDZ domain-containing protein [Candidatus Aegiribacteria sp.]|nr:PDZ domain-containing protein [Candidatus Aegiribacteria sp.]MBD3294683.1 PDZ domain-containing protein [Candidatus Fermentibacteria bacterium]
MKKFLPGWMTAALAIGLLVAGGLMILPSARAYDAVSTNSSIELFMDVFSRTSVTYVDSVGSQELIEAALRGMLESLDPNSVLLSPDDYENLKIQLSGSFEGVGITIGIREEWLTVISPVEGTPAFRAGMKAGDKIVQIDGESTEGITTTEAVMKIRGPRGSIVDLTVVRPGLTDSLTFSIERDEIDLPSVSASFMLDQEIGYVRLSRFGEETSSEAYQAIESLMDQGMITLILDLRGNAGGLFTAALEISDFFLPSGTLVVSTKGNAVGEDKYYTNNGLIFDGELVVLVDGGSASSSEIVAGALQDNGAATLIGSRTFGKGSVQTLMDLGEFPGLGHYGVKLTTARYFTPSGRSIDRTLNEDFLEEDQSDSLEGWGIEPDISVELQEVTGSLPAELYLGSVFFKFATDYVLENEIEDDFWPDSTTVEAFRQFLTEEGYEWEEGEFQDNNYYIERALFSEIAARVWDREMYHRMMAPHDETVQRALQFIREDS